MMPMSLQELFAPSLHDPAQIAAVDALLGNPSEDISLAQQRSVTTADIQRMATQLRSLVNTADTVQKLTINSYAAQLHALTERPSNTRMEQYVLKQLERVTHNRGKTGRREFRKILAILDDLSTRAHIAIYVLMVDGEVSYRYMADFLLNPVHKDRLGRVEFILETALELFNYRIENYGSSFIPDDRDEKYLGDVSRVRSTIMEQTEALWQAQRTDATHIRLDHQYIYDWETLTENESVYLRNGVIRELDLERRYTYRNHNQIRVDVAVSVGDRDRAIELKFDQSNYMHPHGEQEAKILLQAVRYGLALRYNDLERIQYKIRACSVAQSFLDKLKAAFEAGETPHDIKILNRRPRPRRASRSRHRTVPHRPSRRLTPLHEIRGLPPIPVA